MFTSKVNMNFNNPLDFRHDTNAISKTHLLSVSDDEKTWNCLLTAANQSKDASYAGMVMMLSL